MGTRDGEVTRWLLPEALLEQRWDGPPDGGEGPVVAVGLWWGHVWAIWDIGGELRLVDLSDDRVADRLPLPGAGIDTVVFPRDEERLLLALGDGSLVGWRPSSGALEMLDAVPSSLDPAAEAVRWGAAGFRVEDLLDTRQGPPIGVHVLRAGPAKLSADGLVLVGFHSRRVALWYADAPRALEHWAGLGPVQGLAFSDDGLLVAVQRVEGTVELRDAASGLELVPDARAVLPQEWGPLTASQPELALASLPGVTALARSADERWLVTANQDGRLSRWDLDARRQGRVLDTRLDRMLRADPFSPDALLARAELAALAGRWGRVADLLQLAEQQGAAVHAARILRALCLAGRLGGAKERLEQLTPALADDPAVLAWAAWLREQPGG